MLILLVVLCNTTFSFSGATKPVYAPEPFDVGRKLEVDIISESQHIILATTGLIDPGLVLTLNLH